VEERTKPVDHRNKPQLFGNEPQIHQGMTEYSVIPKEWVDWCRENYPDVDYHSEFDSYCNWSQSSPNGAKKDHFAAFKNWIKRSAEERAKKNPESKTMSVLRVLRDV
jgi:hypothetical protein